jgi:hypothetical protein
VVFLSRSKSVHFFLSFVYICIAIEDTIIRRWGLGSHHWLNPATFLCLSQARTWISYNICCGLVYVQWVEVRGDCCWGERWLLLRWEMIVVEVRCDCCWGERWLLLRWEVIVVEVRGDCCWGERWLFVLFILVELLTITV